MITLRNLRPQTVTVRLKILDEGGNLVLWPETRLDHHEFELEPEMSFAASFLPGNQFSSNPPQDFKGHALLECWQRGPFGDIDVSGDVLVWALAAFNQWKYGVNLPGYRPGQDSFPRARTLWQWVYAIPYYDDLQGATRALWQTGVTIQNYESRQARVKLSYTIGQTYQEAGKMFEFPIEIPPAGGVRFDLLRGNPGQNVPGLLQAGYPPDLNSEGHIDMVTDSPILLLPSLIIANQDYSFMVGETL